MIEAPKALFERIYAMWQADDREGLADLGDALRADPGGLFRDELHYLAGTCDIRRGRNRARGIASWRRLVESDLDFYRAHAEIAEDLEESRRLVGAEGGGAAEP